MIFKEKNTCYLENKMEKERTLNISEEKHENEVREEVYFLFLE